MLRFKKNKKILQFKKPKKVRNFKSLKFFFLIIMILISLVILIYDFAYSKYSQKIELKSNTQIANYEFEVKNNGKEIVKDVLNDDQIIYDFSVQNFSESISNDVKNKYNIILELSQNNPPLIIELYRINDNGNEEKLELENYSTKNPEIFNIGDKSRNYKIKVSYDKNNKTSRLNNEFNIKMKAINIQEEWYNEK